MSIRPNHRARRARAGRLNIDIPSIGDTFKRFKWFTIGLIIIFPIYPSLSLLGAGGYARAGEYDESTIITAYNDFGDTAGASYISDTGLIRVGDTEAPGKSLISPKEDGTNQKTAKKHTVKSRESVRSISDTYGVSADAILWANDLSPDDELKIGQVLQIPPISGVIHPVVAGDTVSEIAQKYHVDPTDIVSVNQLHDVSSIRIGMDLMIPGAIKKTTPAVIQKTDTPTPVAKTGIAKVATKIKDTNDAKIAPKEAARISSSKTGLKDRYLVKYTGKSRGFVSGQCTWYVAQNKDVSWRGNAGAWIANARKAGIPTGKTPIVGAIIQFSGRGYSGYGHVGIVADVKNDTIIIKDMNYRGPYEVTIREIPIDDDAIDGYIYVD